MDKIELGDYITTKELSEEIEEAMGVLLDLVDNIENWQIKELAKPLLSIRYCINNQNQQS